MTTYDALREQHLKDLERLLPAYTQRLDWPAEEIASAQEEGLRRIAGLAKAASPWHAERLRAIDPGLLTLDDLGRLPTMTKDDLMAHWDAIVTDRRLNLDLGEAHLETLTGDAYLLDRYHVVASGGSSGRRGVFVYGWDAWAVCYAGFMRWLIRRARRDPELRGRPLVQASVTAEVGSHMSSAGAQTFSNTEMPVHRFPVTLPLDEIVTGLNAVQPHVLQGYPSALHGLVREVGRRRLTISPRLIVTRSEPLLPETRAALEEAWHAPVLNCWGSSEGGATGVSCGEAPGVHLSEDLLIIEPVDEAGRAVPPGETAAKVYLTNLYNNALPLIRYELNDEVAVLTAPCPCGSAFVRAGDPQGRADDAFTYGSRLTVHPHVFRSPLGRERSIVEYQVRQTERGAEISVRCAGAVDLDALTRTVCDYLEQAGLADPEVSIVSVDQIGRSRVGKLKRFVPLSRAVVQ